MRQALRKPWLEEGLSDVGRAIQSLWGLQWLEILAGLEARWLYSCPAHVAAPKPWFTSSKSLQTSAGQSSGEVMALVL